MKFLKHYPEDIVEYIVIPSEERTPFEKLCFSFKTREEARVCKRMMKKSKQSLKTQILKREYFDGHITQTEIH